ncbi:vitamin B12 dependent-methionine synthase activation domain-containing protein, partial [Priestia megaterium]|uniref:vitamin B12 dependent-methionine synthase activation domain-containing protein n=1 Tax=Priestia megaterium TaxID=1404 RepID=UPI00370966C2
MGYGGCGEVEEEGKVFKLIKGEEMGIELREGLMMEGEGCVRGVVFGDGEGKYF